MTKITRYSLQKRFQHTILLIYLLSAGVCISDEATGMALQEARIARETAERRCAQLEIELEQTRKELGKMRSRYADLYLRSHGLLKSLRQTELQVANLWHNKEESSSERLNTQLLEVLEATGKQQLEVVKAFEEYERVFRSMLEVIQPSESLRQTLIQSLSGIREKLEGSISLLASVKEPEPVRKRCRVLASDAELEAVILEGGSHQGMKTGTQWKLERDGEIKARLLVTEVRLERSAAILLEGSLTDVAVGSLVQPVVNSR